VIPLPDPPLRSGDLVLRPWHLDDAPALVAAWADPEIQRWTAVPMVREQAYAERWIAGDEERRQRNLSLDLAIDRDGVVAGEVGFVAYDLAAEIVELGWWVAPAHRGLHVASTAAGLLAEWIAAEQRWTTLVRCNPENPASAAVARNAGFHPGWTDSEGEIWVRP
jgi:[ribosomal protein S5]-alanine N-acetyltransferase